MKKIILAFVLSLSLTLSFFSCSKMKVQDFEQKQPVFTPEQFFLGKTIGTGQFWDRFKNLSLSFRVELEGKWDGSILTLDEVLIYDSGEKFTRQYIIKKIDQNNYTLNSSDLAEEGQIQAYGNSLKWSYYLNQEIDGKIVKLYFDDWMFLQPNSIVINRAFAQKFGLDVGEVVMFIQKAG